MWHFIYELNKKGWVFTSDYKIIRGDIYAYVDTEEHSFPTDVPFVDTNESFLARDETSISIYG